MHTALGILLVALVIGGLLLCFLLLAICIAKLVYRPAELVLNALEQQSKDGSNRGGSG
jgi:hypothetical protein